MLVKSLTLSGYRNLSSATLEPGPRFNVFSGNNGQGKTNLLEALYTVSTLRSFRTPRLRDLINIHQDQAQVSARVFREGLERRYHLTIGERSRIVRLDNKAVRPISRYFGDFNLVLFAPEDLLVAKGSPGEKRRFLDRAVFTLSPQHLSIAQDFEKVLRSRNAVLRDDALSASNHNEMLGVYDSQLSVLSAQMLQARLRYLARVEQRFTAAFESITRSNLSATLDYQVCGDLANTNFHNQLAEQDTLSQEYYAALVASRHADLRRGSTNIGPHRDVLQFRLAGQPAANFASQGQLRAMILAWKTAEMDLLSELHGDPPALLLDDVSSELDPQRNEYLFAFLRTRENQCFISTTHPSFVLLSEDRRDFSVVEGQISEC